MVSLLYVFIWWDLVPTLPRGKLHPVAMLIVTVISIKTNSVLKTQFLHAIGFHGFILIVFNLPDSSVSSQNLFFPCHGCQEERGCMFLKKGGITESVFFPSWVSRGEGLHVSKERGNIKKEGGMKKGRGLKTPFPSMPLLIPDFFINFSLIVHIKFAVIQKVKFYELFENIENYAPKHSKKFKFREEKFWRCINNPFLSKIFKNLEKLPYCAIFWS